MIKLIHILKDILLEMGDTAKPYSFTLEQDNVIEKGEFKDGAVEYTFQTKDGDKYYVEADYIVTDPEDTQDDHQAAEIGFTTSNGFINTDKFDIGSIMSTIVAIIKEIKKKYDFEYICYVPAARDKEFNPDEKKKDQKDKLYKYFIKKVYPNAKFIDVGSHGLTYAKIS